MSWCFQPGTELLNANISECIALVRFFVLNLGCSPHLNLYMHGGKKPAATDDCGGRFRSNRVNYMHRVNCTERQPQAHTSVSLFTSTTAAILVLNNQWSSSRFSRQKKEQQEVIIKIKKRRSDKTKNFLWTETSHVSPRCFNNCMNLTCIVPNMFCKHVQVEFQELHPALDILIVYRWYGNERWCRREQQQQQQLDVEQPRLKKTQCSEETTTSVLFLCRKPLVAHFFKAICETSNIQILTLLTQIHINYNSELILRVYCLFIN